MCADTATSQDCGKHKDFYWATQYRVWDCMHYTRHTPLLFLLWQLAQHPSRANPQSSPSEQPKCSAEPPIPTGMAVKSLEGLGVWVAPGLLLLWGNSSDCKLMLLLLCNREQGSVSFSAELSFPGLPDLASDPRNLLGRAQLWHAFLHKQQWNLHSYITASYAGWPRALTVCYPSKLNFWLLKVFLKSPSEFSDNIFHYLMKAKITAKNALNVKRPGMLMVSASMLQGQGAATSCETASPLEGKICLDTFPLLLNQRV